MNYKVVEFSKEETCEVVVSEGAIPVQGSRARRSSALAHNHSFLLIPTSSRFELLLRIET
ncbi:hypothetical protein COCCADRAFT_10144 [Bipolaris zeicola 26-R-13]|uniref:Uncharacterized protein n=1 Tax=Cochliobolus carbonum (strain 26-R-13) TaxID=930089 RepID=W6XWV7_COCC2|nr:uncharacterized protein COCCADRAFT_10144 [Bipolaris zeicola 26-R-13]EUC27209.1 hypothetical protein COCCADRAFT_10144 [Bipolaris zeicola 26-R-13]